MSIRKVRQSMGIWAARSSNLVALHNTVRHVTRSLAGVTVTWEHRPHAENWCADALANAAVDCWRAGELEQGQLELWRSGELKRWRAAGF